MKRAWILAAALCAAAAACKRAPPGPAAPPPAPAAAPDLAPAAADPGAARLQNRQGMKRYKAKDYAGAAAAFRAALGADPGHVLARYNLACVLALSGDGAGALGELEQLGKSPDPAALRALVRGEGDDDLKSLRKDPRAKELFAAAAERALIIGFRPLARGTEASAAEIKALAEEDPSGVMAVRGEVVAARPGDETVVVSLRGAKLLDRAGKELASVSADWVGFAEARTGGVAHLLLGQVVPDEEPEIVVHGDWTGRRMQGSGLVVLKRKGAELVPILDLDLSRSEFGVPEDGDESAGEGEISSTDTSGEIELLADGALRHRSREEGPEGKRRPWKVELLRWSAAKFSFVAEGGQPRR